MKTRTLILLAAACGVAILVAGGVFIWRVTANRDELTVPEIRSPGQSQQVGDVTATVAGSADVGSVVVVKVQLESGKDRPDAGAGWSLVVIGEATARRPVAIPDGQGTACAGMPLVANQAVACSLAFPAGDGDRIVALAVGDVQRQWKL